MAKKIDKVDILNGPIWKSLFLLSVPLIISGILQICYNLTDAYFLGQLGKDELAAPTVSFPIIFVFNSLTMGFAQAGATLVAQYTGMKREDMAEKAAAHALLVTIFLSIIFSLPGIIFSKDILSLMGVSGKVLEYGTVYLKIVLFSAPFQFLFNLSLGILRGWGNSKVSITYTTFSVILNVILDPIFIFTFKMGVIGAAVATAISITVVGIYAVYMLFNGKQGFKIHPKDFVYESKYIKDILRIGLPPSLGYSITAMGFSFIMGVVSHFGTSVLSAYGIGERVNSIIVSYSGGISMAVSTMVGQFLGAGETKKAEETLRKAAVFTFFSVLFMCFFIFLFGHNITKIFINDPEVIKNGEILFSLVSLSLPFFSLMQIFNGALSGSGHTLQSTSVDMIRLWAVRIPLISTLAYLFGFKGIFYAMIVSNIAAMLLAFLFLKFGNWKHLVIKNQSIPETSE